jgi:hypothetical protein
MGVHQREFAVRDALDCREAESGRRRLWHRQLLGLAVALAIGVPGLSACVADAAPTMGTPVAGDGQATVSWSAPIGDNGALIAKYVVIPYVGGVAQPRRTFNSNATTQVVTGLTNGTTYTFVVYGINHLGHDTARSEASAPVTPILHQTWFLNLESIDAAGGASVVFLDPQNLRGPCSVPAGTYHQCQYSVPTGEDFVLQAVPDEASNEIQWAGGCASVFGDSNEKCLVIWTQDGFSNVDVFFLDP